MTQFVVTKIITLRILKDLYCLIRV